MTARTQVGLVGLLMLALVSGCATSEGASGESDREPVRLEGKLAGDLETYYRETTLPLDVAVSTQRFRRRLKSKARRLKQMQERLETVIEEAKPDDDKRRAAAALYRIAEMYLNFGCEIARLEAPDRLNKQQTAKFEGMLRRKSFPLLEKSDTVFGKLETVDVPTRQSETRRFRDAWSKTSDQSDGERADRVCADTRNLWKKAKTRMNSE